MEGDETLMVGVDRDAKPPWSKTSASDWWADSTFAGKIARGKTFLASTGLLLMRLTSWQLLKASCSCLAFLIASICSVPEGKLDHRLLGAAVEVLGSGGACRKSSVADLECPTPPGVPCIFV